MFTRRWPLAILVALIYALFARETGATAAGDLVLLAGDGEGGYAVNAFLPAAITVRQGSSIRWDFPWYEPHTISFGTPTATPIISKPSPATYDGTGFVTSDVTFGPGKSYTIQFTRVGTYAYHCLVHPYQAGTVVVVDASSTLVDSQATADARSRSEYSVAVAELKSIAAAAGAAPIETHQLADGTAERIIKIARETQYGDVQQYFPPRITIREGDTLTWRSAARTPHTVTLGPFPAGVPLPGNPLVDAVSRPGNSYEGTGYWNSGVLGIDRELGTEFSLTFPRPGTYAYYCILHANQGQTGTVDVVARVHPAPAPPPGASPTPLPPATGSGIARDEDGLPLAPFAAAAVIAALLLWRRLVRRAR